MKQITITINVENSAFEPDCYEETSRILSTLAENMQQNGFIDDQPIRDINGNHVGTLVTE